MKYITLLFAFTLFGFTPYPTYKKSELLGKFNFKTHPAFSKVSNGFSDRDIYLRTEVNIAFTAMALAAKNDSVDLKVISGTRNFSRQTEIWNGKWNTFSGSEIEKAKEILLYSSMPGTTRHHWGTDFDLNALEPEYFETEEGVKLYNWLKVNAWQFGFFQPYYKKGEERTAGYNEEKWHWSYYPTSNQMLRAYNNSINYKDLKDYKGSELADSLKIFENYVNAVCVPKNLEYKKVRNRYLSR
jgi:D-alanyl-D-alanine carboxypeptidase